MKKTNALLVFLFVLACSFSTWAQVPDSWTKWWGPPIGEAFVASNEIYITDAGTSKLIKVRYFPFPQIMEVSDPAREFAIDATGNLYKLATDGQSVWKYEGTGKKWTKIGGPAQHIYAGGNKLFATNPQNGEVWEYGGTPLQWARVGAPGSEYVIDGKNNLYVLSPQKDQIWVRHAATKQWKKLGGAAKHIYGGGDKLYATNPQSGDIMEYLQQEDRWIRAGSPGKMFAVDNKGQLFGLSPSGDQIWAYDWKTRNWTHVGGPAEAIFAGGDGELFLKSTQTGTLWRRTTNNLAKPVFSLKPVSGIRPVLTILWDPKRPDHPAPSKAMIENVLIGPGQSVEKYFREVSGNKFTIRNAGILGWFTADSSAAHYWGKWDTEDLPEDRNENGILDPGEDLNHNGKLDGRDNILQADEDLNHNGKLDHDLNHDGWIRGHREKWAEAIKKADPYFNFAKYDANGDKELSANELSVLIVIPQNNPFGTQRDAYGLEFPKLLPLTVDGVVIDSIVEAYIGSPPSVGLVAHELSHILLGTGDMYIDAPFVPFRPGPYSLMDMTPAIPTHLDPFHKLKLGWLRPKIIPTWVVGGQVMVNQVERHNEVLILQDVNRNNKEYFIVENRWRGTSFDQSLPYAGLAVWHVIEDPAVYNATPPPPGVSPGQWAEWKTGGWGRMAVRMIRPVYGPPMNYALWNGSSPNTGYNLLSIDANPQHVSLKWADGSPSGFYIRSIPPAGPAMNVEIGFQNPKPN